ncbi:hypothetical protein [Caulobacter segnis]
MEEMVESSRDLTDAEVAEAHEAGAAAKIEFDRSLSELLETVTRFDQIEVLARAAFYLAVRGLSSKDKSAPFELVHLEILQALALSRPRTDKKLSESVAGVTQRQLDLIRRNGAAYRDMASSKVVKDTIQNERETLLALIRGWTFGVRGARHPHQTREFALALATRVGASFKSVHGYDAIVVVRLIENIIELVRRRAEGRIQNARTWMMKSTATAMIEAYAAQSPTADIARLKKTLAGEKKRSVQAYLWNESEAALAVALTFKAEDVAEGLGVSDDVLAALLSGLSLGFEGVTAAELQHLHLANPIRLRPLIRLDNTLFFCPSPQSLGLATVEILENLCVAGDALKRRSEGARANWLEEKLADVVRRSLPRGEVYTRVKRIDNVDGRDGENDVVVFIDKTLILFEAKSGKISPAARRGALNSLKSELRETVGDGSTQSFRMKRHIQTAKGPVTLETDQGNWTIDPAQVRDIVRVNVLLEAVGPLSSHGPGLVRTGLVKPEFDLAPSMSVFELETVMEVLPYEVERCFYLLRRGEFERNVSYTADEFDLLAYYLQTQFNVGEDEFEGAKFQLYGMSDRVTIAYSDRRERGEPHPPVVRTPYWNDMLRQLDETWPVGATRMSARLLRVPLDGQRAFEKLVREGRRKTAQNPMMRFSTGMSFGQIGRRNTLALCVGAPSSDPDFAENVQRSCESAFGQSGSPSLLLIYHFNPPTGRPYDFIGVYKHPPARHS